MLKLGCQYCRCVCLLQMTKIFHFLRGGDGKNLHSYLLEIMICINDLDRCVMRASISSVRMIPFNEIVQGSVHHRGEAALCIIGAKLRSQILALPSWKSFNRKHGWAREQFLANSMIALKAVVKSIGVNESLRYLLHSTQLSELHKTKKTPQQQQQKKALNFNWSYLKKNNNKMKQLSPK